ncbi:unnamed protein product [Pelagomonas calceolata]|uniref:DUF1279 domain-containing protein n=1 Tax=Pelagomonas calceolata TaxID=35677 RepID=A0A8J2SGY0_9STRA|nr:unnamed protein product [Pelagomonas calceolata]
MAFRATRVLTRHARQRSSSVIAQLPRVTRSATSTTGGITQRFCTPTRRAFGAGGLSGSGPPGAHTDASASRRSFGAGSIGGRPRDDDDDDDAKSMRRQKFDAFVERGKERLGPERVERLERLNEKRKVHAAYVREAGKGSELSMSERMKRLVSAYGPLALGFHVTTEVVVCGLFYLAVDHGLDVGALLRVVESMTGTDMSTVVSSGAGTLGVAYALTVALTGIPRTFLTIAATPYIARKLGWRPKKDV